MAKAAAEAKAKQSTSPSREDGSGSKDADGKRKRHKKGRAQGTSSLSSIIAARCATALKCLMNKDGAYLFLESVNRAEYPEYFKVIKKPIDLGARARPPFPMPGYWRASIRVRTWTVHRRPAQVRC
eukprot:COSAG01_NODE_4169_length_5274_cov_8.543575_3_plen_126_part_00